jgi:hypothetical protein
MNKINIDPTKVDKNLAPKYLEFLVKIAQGLENIHHPTKGAGREWIPELSMYLRGHSAAILILDPIDMKKLQELALLAEFHDNSINTKTGEST